MEMVFSYIFIPLLIFIARVIDVSLGTVRIIFISKGFKFMAFILGFVEVLVWLIAIKQLWANLNSPLLYMAYALGFATGNYVGICIDEKLSFGTVLLRIIIKKSPHKLLQELKKNNYPATVIDCYSEDEKTDVKMIFSVLRRKDLKKVLYLLNKTNPGAFYTTEDVRNLRKDSHFSKKHKVLFERKIK